VAEGGAEGIATTEGTDTIAGIAVTALDHHQCAATDATGLGTSLVAIDGGIDGIETGVGAAVEAGRGTGVIDHPPRPLLVCRKIVII
jgi:hypothetical protein